MSAEPRDPGHARAGQHGRPGQEEYACPMHPDVSRAGPGTCPKCGMGLEPRGDAHEEAKTGPLEHNMFAMGHEMYPWTQLPLMLLGAWLIATPSTFGYDSLPVSVSDMAAGTLVIVLAWLGLDSKRFWTDLANVAVGIWVMFAPLAFWAPTAGVYANDTLVGALIISFALLVPMLMPMRGGDVPPDWSYNPSTWVQRAPIIALAVASFLMARYMGAFQLGHVGSAWDPLFADGTEQILQSDVSKAWPISDAGLGAFVYLVELLSTLMGDRRRWRTMPWMVAIFGVAVVPLGIVSIVLVILQPVAVGTWCFLCLLSAAFMLIMIPLSLDEIVAMLQFLVHSKRAGRSLVSAFFLGGEVEHALPAEDVRPDYTRSRSMVWGVTPGWHLLASAALGAALMAAPGLLASTGAAADHTVVIGALVVTVSIIATADVARAVQLLNVPLAAWALFAPWLLEGAGSAHRWAAVIAAALITPMAFRRFPLRESYGRWTRKIPFATRHRVPAHQP